MHNNIKYWIWLSIVSKTVSLNTIYRLLKIYKSPEKIWNLDEKNLFNNNVSKFEIDQMLNIRNKNSIENFIYCIEKNNIKIITYESENYPQNLKEIYNPPVVIYAKGDISILNSKSIAIVGCRNCSNYGKTVAEEFARNMGENNITIVSGLAKGIDTWAHIGAINAGSKTIAVLGTGFDKLYPKENMGIYNKILDEGLVITEYIIGTKLYPKNFPRRNRIISGISRGVLVVEAKERSGSLITADLALEQGKDVYAIPGSIYSSNSKGTNNLIKQGAKPVTDYKEILEDIV